MSAVLPPPRSASAPATAAQDSNELRATLHGSAAELGTVPARDIARIIVGLEAALAAAAYTAAGRPRRAATGRHRGPVEAASRLRFTSVEPGSVVTVLGLPTLAPDDESAFSLEVSDLATAALNSLLSALDGADVDLDIARVLASLADDLDVGVRYSDLEVTRSSTAQTLRLDGATRQRLHAVMRQTDHPSDFHTVVGSLSEADFDKRTARLRTPTGETVVVTFSEDLADDVHEALREHAGLQGLVTFDPATGVARRVDLSAITTPTPTPLADDSFWASTTIDELAAAQGVGIPDLDRPLTTLSDDERRELAAALAELEL